ncbi:MAG: 2-dehydro-3-deoxygalactonokinase [bacterium]|jgi:2-dehydro-3-deoxygalactonokinase
MKICVIDCGTSTIRVMLAEGRTLLAKETAAVGVRATAISGTNSALKAGITRCWEGALSTAGLRSVDIGMVIASGMITSNLGLIDLPHLVAPVGEDELRTNMVVQSFPEVIPLPIHFVRGIRNAVNLAGKEAYTHMDFMRGEETQVIGLLHLLDFEPPFSIVNLSSHTKIIGVDSQGRILGSVTTLSGQLFAALRESTLIADSLPKSDEIRYEEVSLEMARRGFQTVLDFGLLRAIFVPRLLDILLPTTPMERLSFLEGALVAGDYQCMPLARRHGLPLERLVVAGDPLRTSLFQELLRSQAGFRGDIITMDTERMDQATLVGACALATRG